MSCSSSNHLSHSRTLRVAIIVTLATLIPLALMLFLSSSLAAHAGIAAAAPQAPSASTLLLSDDFDYGTTPMSLTTASGGNWVAHSGAGNGPVQYITTSLAMSGYGSSGVGGAATVSTSGSEDVNRSFITQSSGIVYFAALVNVSTAATGDYFLHLKDASTGFRARVFVRDSSGMLNFGLGTTGAATYSTVAFNYATTYLVVGKYAPSTGDTALYVLDTFSASEPATPLISLTGTSLTVQAIAIRQGASGQRPAATIDGVRVANTWADALGVQAADLDVAKSAPSVASPGDTIDYTISLSNTGNITATETTVTDTLPGVNFVTYTTLLANTFSQSGNQLIWQLSDIVSQTTGLTITVQVTVPTNLATQTILTNTVTASTTATETVTSNNTASAFTTIRQADLVPTKIGPAVAMPGEQIAYTITVANIGYPGTSDLVVTDTLPDYASYVTDTTGVAPGVSGQTYVWTLPGVAAGGESSFSLVVNVSPTISLGSVLTNTVDVATSDVEESLANNHAEWVVTIGAPDLVVTKEAPITASPGDVIPYTLTVVNDGAVAATNVWLTDTLPAATSYLTDTLGGYTGQIGQVYGWSLGTLNPSDSITFTVSVTVSPSARANNSLVNIASATEAELDQEPLDNTYIVTTTVLGANPYVLKDGPAMLVGGDVVSYTIVYGNSGNQAANVTITDTLPNGFAVSDIITDTSVLAFVDGTNTRTWAATVAAGNRVTFTLALAVPNSAAIASGTLVTNTVQAATDAAGNDSSDDVATATGTVYQIVPIATARAGSEGQMFVITGTVTVEPGVFTYNGQYRYMYVQDDTAGVLVYRGGGLNPVARGNIVRIFGARSEYKAETEFLPTNADDVVDLGPGVAVSPLVTNTGSIDESVEGELVQISGQVTGKPASYRLQVNDGSGMVEVNRYFNLGQITDTNYIDFSPFVVGDYVRVVGVTRGYTESFGFTREVLPRGPADMAEYPRVLSFGPADGAVDVAVNTSLTATFNLTMSNVNTSTFLLQGPGGAVAGTVTYDTASNTAMFTPAANLAFGAQYTAVLKSGLQAYNGLSLMPAQDVTWTFTTLPAVPDLSTSTKSNAINGRVQSGDLVTYTISLINTGAANATTMVTDVLPSYYVVANALDFSQATTGTLTWTGVVTAGQTVNVRFVVRVTAAQLPIGPDQILENSATVNDGLHPEFILTDQQPPMITIYGIYLPLIMR